MRTVFLLLLLVNAALFLWWSGQPQGVEKAISDRPVAPNGVAKLVLLSERPAVLTTQEFAAVQPEDAPAEDVDAPPPANLCFVFGPVADAAVAVEIRESLASMGVVVAQRVTERRELSGYWVYFPPFPSLREAEQRLQTLKEAGIKDMFVLGRGEQRNAISLGLFKRHAAAKGRVKQLQDLGYDPVLEVQYQSSPEYLVDVEIPGDAPALAVAVTEFAAARPEVEMTPRNCN